MALNLTMTPYLLVYRDGEAAVYSRKYRLIDEWVSKQLITYAQTKHTQRSMGFSLTKPDQQPSWMTEEKKATCVMYHLWDDSSTMAVLKAIPQW